MRYGVRGSGRLAVRISVRTGGATTPECRRIRRWPAREPRSIPKGQPTPSEGSQSAGGSRVALWDRGASPSVQSIRKPPISPSTDPTGWRSRAGNGRASRRLQAPHYASPDYRPLIERARHSLGRRLAGLLSLSSSTPEEPGLDGARPLGGRAAALRISCMPRRRSPHGRGRSVRISRGAPGRLG